MGALRALQANTAEGPARFAAARAPPIEKYPEIHDLAHKITLAGSACNQHVHRADGLKLVYIVNRSAEIYWATKDIKTVRKPCPYPPNIEVVYPVL